MKAPILTLPQLTKALRAAAACCAVAGLALLAACGGSDDHDHDHDSDHDHDHEGEHAHGDHDHDDHDHGDGEHAHEKKTPGPNGGRILTEVEPHLEFLLKDDHTIQITALTEDAKPAPIGDQVVTVTGGDRSAPADLTFTKQGETFAKQGDVLVSSGPFPKGKKLPVIVSVQAAADAEPTVARFSLDLSECPDCDYLEYACICDHEH